MFIVDFFKSLIDGFRPKERYECRGCDRHIMSSSTPKVCPHCHASADKIRRVPPKIHALKKR